MTSSSPPSDDAETRPGGTRSFARFLLVGLVTTAASYALFVALELVLPYLIAYAIAYVAGIVLSYLLNTRVVFRVARSWSTFLRFPLVYVFQFVLGSSVIVAVGRVAGHRAADSGAGGAGGYRARHVFRREVRASRARRQATLAATHCRPAWPPEAHRALPGAVARASQSRIGAAWLRIQSDKASDAAIHTATKATITARPASERRGHASRTNQAASGPATTSSGSPNRISTAVVACNAT